MPPHPKPAHPFPPLIARSIPIPPKGDKPLLIIIKPKSITNEIYLKDIIKISLEKDGLFNRYTLYTKDDEFQYQFNKNSEQEILNYLKSGIEKATDKKVSATSNVINFV